MRLSTLLPTSSSCRRQSLRCALRAHTTMPQFSLEEETEIFNDGDSTVKSVACVHVSDSEDEDYVPSLANGDDGNACGSRVGDCGGEDANMLDDASGPPKHEDKDIFTRPMIPKPVGEAGQPGRGGYDLKRAMGLESSKFR
jgi:hypothetical protein